MKKSDWALIILIVAVVGVISYFVIGSVLPEPEDEKVKTAPDITASIDTPVNNVLLYDADRPSWCPRGAGDDVDTGNAPENGENTQNENNANEPNGDENGGTADAGEGRQAINLAFNACAINSSFTSITGE
ncbi:PLD nuclease N-terminal domain-containing protein [Candidatus Saccharibacteria bacterium]|nr:PLD nuclease N-terminal domain-containing protein [Candidatus Saccharibacteria bacterium]